MRKSLFLLFVSMGLILNLGCLKTRAEMKEEEQRTLSQQQIVTMQKSHAAETNSRMVEIDEQLRELNGRVEVVENKISNSGQEQDASKKNLVEQNQDLQRRMNLLQESMGKMEMQIAQLSNELATMKTENSATTSKKKEVNAGKKGTYDQAQELFNQKDWKKAILSYQKYRDENPRGKYFADATYKIGVCFQELAMKDEAKTFYEEVASKYPNSEEARRAKTRLKTLKK